MTELLPLLGAEITAQQQPEFVSKAAFATELGVAKSRVSQLVKMGLPVSSNGKVHRQPALDWYQKNIDASRRKALTTRQL